VNTRAKRALRRLRRKAEYDQRLRAAFDQLPWQMSTVCVDCDRFVVCGGYTRQWMRCLTCFGKHRAARARGKGRT